MLTIDLELPSSVNSQTETIATVALTGGKPLTVVVVRLKQVRGIEPFFETTERAPLDTLGSAVCSIRLKLQGPTEAVLVALADALICSPDAESVTVL
jgi:hypothetical protein